MLLELYDLDAALTRAGVTPGVTEQRIQPYPNRMALEVRIGSDGNVAAVSVLSTDSLAIRRKFECSKGGMREAIPGFNVDPLWRLNSSVGESWARNWSKAWRSAAKSPSPDKRLALLDERRCVSEPNWNFDDNSKINVCLMRASLVLERELSGAGDARIAPLFELLARCRRTDARKLHEQVSAVVREAGGSSIPGLPVADYPALLFSDRDPNKGKPLPNEAFSLVLELDDPSPFGGMPANHQDVWSAVNQHLTTKASPNGGADKLASDPPERPDRVGIFGEPLTASIGSMPEKTLPRLGKVKLFSLSAQTPCQHRYGLIESDACPVGPEIQDRLAAALGWIGDPSREHQTWADVSNSAGYKQPALLFAFPHEMPVKPAFITSMFVKSSPKVDEATAEQDFLSCAKVTVAHLQTIVNRDPALSITVMVIAKADTARKKLLFSHRFRAGQLRQAADDWRAAAENVPPIDIRGFDKDGKKVIRRPVVPFPNQVVQIVNTCWDSNGEKPKAVSNIRIGLGLTLLLETGSFVEEAALEALRYLVLNLMPFVLALGQARAHRLAFTKGGSPETPLLIPSVLGLIMTKADPHESGKLRGAYMQSNAYLIGKLLGIADEFQREYCRHERKGVFPPQFIGNALMPVALENPAKGLAQLADRLPLYHRTADEKLRDRAGVIERDIDKSSIPESCSDVQKAQMLLGYLACSASDIDVTSDPTPTRKEKP